MRGFATHSRDIGGDDFPRFVIFCILTIRKPVAFSFSENTTFAKVTLHVDTGGLCQVVHDERRTRSLSDDSMKHFLLDVSGLPSRDDFEDSTRSDGMDFRIAGEVSEEDDFIDVVHITGGG